MISFILIVVFMFIFPPLAFIGLAIWLIYFFTKWSSDSDFRKDVDKKWTVRSEKRKIFKAKYPILSTIMTIVIVIFFLCIFLL